MNPGSPVEEVGQTSRTLIDALKGQPAVLALTIANFALLAFIFYALREAAQYREKLMARVFENGREINQLISECSKRGELQWPGTEEKPHSSVIPSTNSSSTFIASVSQAGDLQGWYCTTPLPRHSINGGTVGPPLNKE